MSLFTSTTNAPPGYFPLNITLPIDYSVFPLLESTTAAAATTAPAVHAANNATTATNRARSNPFIETIGSDQWPMFVNACITHGGVVFKNEELGQCVRRSDFENFIYEGIKPSWGYIFLVLAHLIVFIVGLVGNAMVCVAIWRNRAMRTVTNHYIVNLAVADFLVLIVCLPPTVLWDVLQSWLFGNIMCKVVLYAQFVCVSVSILTLTVISIDRWLAIARPLKFRSNSKRARHAIALVWVVSCLVNLPLLFVYKASENPQIIGNPTPFLDICSPLDSWSFLANTIFDISNLILCYCLPLVIMTVAYIWMARVLWSESADGDAGSVSSFHHVEHADSLSGSGGSNSGSVDGYVGPLQHVVVDESSSLVVPNGGPHQQFQRTNNFRDIVNNSIDSRHLNGSIDSYVNDNSARRRSITPTQFGRSRIDSTDSTFFIAEPTRRSSWQRQWASNSSVNSANSAHQTRNTLATAPSFNEKKQGKTHRPKSFSIKSKKSQFITLYNNNIPLEKSPRPQNSNLMSSAKTSLTDLNCVLPAANGARPRRLAFASDVTGREKSANDTIPLHRPLRRLSSPTCNSPVGKAPQQPNDHVVTESPPPPTPSPLPNGQLLPLTSTHDEIGINGINNNGWLARKFRLISKTSTSSTTSNSVPTTTTANALPATEETQQTACNGSLAVNDNARDLLSRNSPSFNTQITPSQPSPTPLPAGPGTRPLQAKVKRRASAAAVVDNQFGQNGRVGRRSVGGHVRLLGRRFSSTTNVPAALMTTAQLPLLHSGISRGRTLSSAHEHTWRARNKSRRNAAKMLIAVAAFFAICFFPVHLLTLLRDLFNLPDNTFWGIFSLLSHWLCYAQSATNPIIYNIMNKHFRREFRRLLFGCCRSRRALQGKESPNNANGSNRAVANGHQRLQPGGAMTRGITRHGSAPQPGTTPLLPASTWRQQQQRAAAANNGIDHINNGDTRESGVANGSIRPITNTSLRVHAHPQLASNFSVVREKPNDESADEENSLNDTNNNSISPASTMFKSEL